MVKIDRKRVRSQVGGVLLAILVGAPELASWHGLTGFGELLGLSPVWALVVPVSCDAAAAYTAWLALRAVLAGDSAFLPRLLTVAYALASAGFNVMHSTAVHEGIGGALFFGGAACSAALLWDVTLRAWRRDQLRELGLIESPLPRFRLARWALDFGRTARAYRAAVIHGLTDPADALAAVGTTAPARQAVAERVSPDSTELAGTTEGETDVSVEPRQERRNSRETVRTRDHHDDLDCSGSAPGQGSDGLRTRSSGVDPLRTEALQRTRDVLHDDLFRGLSKSEAIAAAFKQLGRSDVPAALSLLAEHGITVHRSTGYEVKKQLEAAAPVPTLRAVGGDQ